MNLQNKAIFLDRDGVINSDKGYVYRKEDIELIEGVFKALRRVKDDYKIFIITNQSGIARGYYTENDFHSLMRYLLKKFEENKIKISGYYYCPHHPSAAVDDKYLKDCECRKPKPGMILKAAREHNIDLSKSYVIGDKVTDAEAGIAAGCNAIIVDYDSDNCGNYKPFQINKHTTNNYVIVVGNLEMAIDYILEKSLGDVKNGVEKNKI